jgi:GntR family transcriptional regulator / MocR family aminotransferase
MPRARKSPASRAGGVLPFTALRANDDRPLFDQLYRAIREHIVLGRLAPGTRLASSRAMAAELGTSRFTVVSALDQLRAEGYIGATERGGTHVARTLPDASMRAGAARRPARGDGSVAAVRASLSQRGEAISRIAISGPRHDTGEPRAFRPRRPPLDVFPGAIWSRVVRRQWKSFRHDLLDYGDPAGLRGLRMAIAEHAAATRGVRCTPEQVIVTAGAQQAYNILFQLLLDPGDAAWIEEPGYLDVRAALVASGARLVPVRVDQTGLDVAQGIAAGPDAKLVYVSPSHQYPTGATLSASRRWELLAWARRSGAWIVEDDYDSYFRYRGRPLPALQSLEAEQLAAASRPEAARVVYVGTFSKTMFPSLRLGYCIVPPALVGVVANARAVADRNSSLTDQAALEIFIREGHYDRHLRRVRAACIERSEALAASVHRYLDGVVSLARMQAGTHVLARVARGYPSPVRIERAAREAGMVIFPLSRYCLERPARDAIVLGYGGLTPRLIEAGVRKLTAMFDVRPPRVAATGVPVR